MTDSNNNSNPPIEDAEVVEETTEETKEQTPADEVLAENTSEETSTEESTEVSPEYATPAATSANDAEEPKDTRFATPNAVTSLLNLESLINRYVVDMEKLQEQLKTQRDMFNDVFNNDPEYMQVMQKVKEANRQKATVKQKIMKFPNVSLMVDKMREYKEEMKDIQEGLSSYLQQYQQLAGTNQITSENGEIREIVITSKLVKRGGRK